MAASGAESAVYDCLLVTYLRLKRAGTIDGRHYGSSKWPDSRRRITNKIFSSYFLLFLLADNVLYYFGWCKVKSLEINSQWLESTLLVGHHTDF